MHVFAHQKKLAVEPFSGHTFIARDQVYNVGCRMEVGSRT
jgi:hypothetical protein